MPLSIDFWQVLSKTSCRVDIFIFVKLYDIWAIPYSSIYQPIPLTALKRPGVLKGCPFSSLIILPLKVFPSLLILPASLMSKATALAFLVEVVFKFILYATRKSRAEIAVAPDLTILLLKIFGP